MRLLTRILLVFILLLFPLATQAAIVNLAAELEPSNEPHPVVAPDAVGSAAMVLDTVTGEFGWVISFEGLTGPATVAHFHNAPAGQAGPAVLNLDIDPGVIFSGIGMDEGLFAGGKTLGSGEVTDIMAGLWYVNIHTALHPAGEIRGQVLLGTFEVVPIPGAVWLLGSGLLGLVGFRRKFRS